MQRDAASPPALHKGTDFIAESPFAAQKKTSGWRRFVSK
jgi:hypothetical protein